MEPCMELLRKQSNLVFTFHVAGLQAVKFVSSKILCVSVFKTLVYLSFHLCSDLPTLDKLFPGK